MKKLRFNKDTQDYIKNWVEDMREEYNYICDVLYTFDGVDAETSIEIQIETTKELLSKLEECLSNYKDKYDFITIKLKSVESGDYGEAFLEDGLYYNFVGYKKRSEKEINRLIRLEILKYYNRIYDSHNMLEYARYFDIKTFFTEYFD